MHVVDFIDDDRCDYCGTANGCHKVLTREDGRLAPCSGGDVRVLHRALSALVGALRMYLPAVCETNGCTALALWHFPGTSHRYCDIHGPRASRGTPLPYAAPLRAAVALLSRAGRPATGEGR